MDLKRKCADFIICCMKMATTALNYIVYGPAPGLDDLWRLGYLMQANRQMSGYSYDKERVSNPG